ncbi:MAG: hypothetical protein KDH91_22455 [Rhodoferax sp.]|nr:hypothetical protein [Rhodoferax sp.]
MFSRYAIVISTVAVLAGCATSVPKGPDTITITGRVAEAAAVAGIAKHAISEDATLATSGVFGMMFASLMGRPSYVVYDVIDAKGQRHVARSQTNFPVGSCVDIVVPKARLAQAMWDIGEVGMEVSEACQ